MKAQRNLQLLARKAFVLFMMTFFVSTIHAQIRGRANFKEDGIWYHIEGEESVSVDFDGVVNFQNISHGCYSGNIIIPETVEHNGKTYTVVKINRLAFYFCPIDSVTLPNTIRSIDQAAFAGCPITELKLPSSLLAFGESVFGGSKIKSIVIPSGVKELPAYLFKQSDLTEITLPSSLEKLGTEVFCQTKITKITIPEGVKAISERAFMQTPLEKINLPSTLKKVDNGAFQETQLTNILLPASVDSIGNYAFCKTKLTEASLPSSLSFLGESAFRECANLVYVNMNCPSLKEINRYTFYQSPVLSQTTAIPDSVQSIGEYAFYGCADLQTIGFSDASQLKTIGNNAFTNSALYSLAIPQTVETISERAFFNCNALENVEYAEGSQLKNIGDEAFKNCTVLKTASLPNTIEVIGVSAFENCSSLLNVSFPQNAETMEANTFNNCTALQTITFPVPSKLKRIKRLAFGQCSSLESLVLPEGLEEIGEASINSGVLRGPYDSKLSYVYIPSTVNFIAENAFANSDAYSGSPRNVTFDLESPIDSVGTHAFFNAERINIKHYDKWMRLICVSQPFAVGRFAHIYHQDTLVTDYILPENITFLRDYCFTSYKDLRSVVLPRNLKDIGESCFSGCTALQSVTFGDSISSFGKYAFEGCAIPETHITNPDSWIRLICNRPNYNGYFKWAWFPNVLFNGEPYVDYIFPDDISNINASAFYGNNQMQSVTLSQSLKTIGEGAFSNCTNLKDVTFLTPPESVGANAFKGCKLQTVDIGDIAKWCAVDFGYNSGPFQYTESPKIIVKGEVLDKLTIPSTVTSIGNYAFYRCQRFDQLTIPNGVTNIGDYAFSGCSDLTTIRFGKRPQLASIGKAAFEGTGFASVQLPGSVQTIGVYAFRACKGLTEVSLSDGLTSIGSEAFSECSALKSITMPNTLKEMKGRVFFNCTALEQIHIPDIAAWCKVNITGEWHNYGNIYWDGQPLTELTIPEGVDTICNYTFYYMKELKKVKFPQSLKVIRERCFSFCDKIDSIAIPEGVKSIGYRSFEGCNSLKYVSLPPSLTGLSGFYVPNAQKHDIELHISDLAGFINAVKDAGGFVFRTSQGYEARLYVGDKQIENLVVPEGVTQMKNIFHSFNFTSVTLPRTLETISGDAFQFCNNLKYVYSRSRFAPSGTNGLMIGNSFQNNLSLQAIYVPNGSMDNYKSKWNQSASLIVEAPESINLSGNVSAQSLTEEVDAHNNVYDDTTPYLDLTDATLDETVTADVLQGIADEGTVVFLPDSTEGIEGTNIVADGRTLKLILCDSTDFVAPYDFTADELLYRRRFAATESAPSVNLPARRMKTAGNVSSATTLCLPFSLSELPEGMKAFALKERDESGNAVFNEVFTIEANMPYLVTLTSDIDSLQFKNVLVKATPAEMPCTSCDGLEFHGTLSDISHDDAASEEAYVLGTNLEWFSVYDADEEVYVPAGHGYLLPTDYSITGNIATGIAEIMNEEKIVNRNSSNSKCYDLSGRRMSKPQNKGIYILKNGGAASGGRKVLVQ